MSMPFTEQFWQICIGRMSEKKRIEQNQLKIKKVNIISYFNKCLYFYINLNWPSALKLISVALNGC